MSDYHKYILPLPWKTLDTKKAEIIKALDEAASLAIGASNECAINHIPSFKIERLNQQLGLIAALVRGLPE